jgi:hypothetical protein
MVVETVEDLICGYLDASFKRCRLCQGYGGPKEAFAIRDLQSRIASLARIP